MVGICPQPIVKYLVNKNELVGDTIEKWYRSDHLSRKLVSEARVKTREVINIERAWSAVLLNIDDQIFVISWYKTADHALSIFITSLVKTSIN